jgi:hypothetical protein
MPIIESIFAEVAGSAIFRTLVAVGRAVGPSRLLTALSLPIPKRLYLRNLKLALREMPFLYRDFDGDCIKDFVDINIAGVDVESLRPFFIPDPGEAARDGKHRLLKRKLLMFGDAGVGKTTFQRHALLTVADRTSANKFTLKGENPIPIYIPIKEVDNSAPQPILRYILSDVELFRHPKGLERLTMLGEQRRLFLFVDGYDELASVQGTQNHVQEELEALLFPRQSKLHGPYMALEMCRMWLASRREFFERNPPGGIGRGGNPSPFNINTEDLAAVELKGIGNRQKLVQVIFNKYKAISDSYREWLNDEFFLSRVDDSHDDELKKLSFNPLFLSVMCFIYAKRVEREQTFDVNWVEGVHDLINKCIDLLLFELDDLKARKEPAARRAALGRRRGEFAAEKRQFLENFAFQLYSERLPLFTLDQLTQSVISFLQATSTQANPVRFVDQLMNSGLIKKASIFRIPVQHDFRHQKFRQVLAASYITTPERYIIVLDRIGEEQFKELLPGLQKVPRFCDPSFQDHCLTRILESVGTDGRGERSIERTAAFVRAKPDSYDMSPAVERFLIKVLQLEAPVFMVSKDLLLRSQVRQELLSEVRVALLSSIGDGRLQRLSLCCSILAHANPLLLQQILEERLSDPSTSDAMRGILLQYACVSNPRWIEARLSELSSHDFTFATLCWVLADASIQSGTVRKLVEVVRFGLNDERLLTLLFCCLGTARAEQAELSVVLKGKDLSFATVDALRAAEEVMAGFQYPLLISKSVTTRGEDTTPTRKLMYLPIGQVEGETLINEIKKAWNPFVYQVRESKEFQIEVEALLTPLLSKALAALPLREKVGFSVEQLAKAMSSDELKNALKSAICRECAINVKILSEADRLLLSRSRLHLTHFFV